MKIAEPKPQQNIFAKKLLDKDPIRMILKIKIAYKINNINDPKKPNSSD